MANPIERFLGGPPLRTLLWLAFLSIVVGFVLATLGLHPMRLVQGVIDAVEGLIDAISRLGLGAFRSVGQYLIWGAIVVVPIWLISRLLSVGRGPR
ncbi:DUF6460 domain-containing protein [Prosthecomicrobium hirschii]|jgi:hypothetical protein|uniref:DUF6460 domain-containing protein n=1 Tax=Prosthecodimorpha hirschii TaxID=665126 RepID=UPI00221F3D60|nr:DUF6460 domain-containing protein [Prosthecomicrobium hirschii]MCW1843106.1 DUF6460 domain-containing protein [Prosthecomicrobium hirschii]